MSAPHYKPQDSVNVLEVWLDDVSGPLACIGTLSHDRGQVRFSYAPDWLREPRAFAIDPGLTLDAQPFFPKSELGNFGIFLDTSPDRWGQTLMKRREALEAKDAGRPSRTLYAWDFLIGVQDITRQGALRFRRPHTDVFLSDEARAAPPVTSLRELEAVAWQLSRRGTDNLDPLRQWLAVLVAPGASLGGARPKANFRQSDGSLWIGKFPAQSDESDVGAWEYVLYQLALRAGVAMPPARVLKLSGDFHTFCVQRFDRVKNQGRERRRFYASAMTLLHKTQSEGSSYLELAQFLRARGNPQHAEADLRQLFRRVAFNVAVGNRDDHLRNHGFILEAGGWRLSPAFDLNPSTDKAEHVLAIDDGDTRPSLETVLSTAAFYGLSALEAREIVAQVATGVGTWREVARATHIPAAECELMSAAFAACDEFLARNL